MAYRRSDTDMPPNQPPQPTAGEGPACSQTPQAPRGRADGWLDRMTLTSPTVIGKREPRLYERLLRRRWTWIGVATATWCVALWLELGRYWWERWAFAIPFSLFLAPDGFLWWFRGENTQPRHGSFLGGVLTYCVAPLLFYVLFAFFLAHLAKLRARVLYGAFFLFLLLLLMTLIGCVEQAPYPPFDL